MKVVLAAPCADNAPMRRLDRSRCPGCGERVSAFAAGCAICGADLDIRRFDRPQRWRPSQNP